MRICDSSEVCNWSNRVLPTGDCEGGYASKFGFKPIPVCNADRQADERDQTGVMMFADNIVIWEKSEEQAEASLNEQKAAMESRGMKISRAKSNYLCFNGAAVGGTIGMQDVRWTRVREFKYYGATMREDGDCDKEVKKRVQTGQNKQRKMSGII